MDEGDDYQSGMGRMSVEAHPPSITFSQDALAGKGRKSGGGTIPFRYHTVRHFQCPHAAYSKLLSLRR